MFAGAAGHATRAPDEWCSDCCILQAGDDELTEPDLSFMCCSCPNADASLAGCRAALEEHEGIMEAAEAQQASRAA